MRTVASEQKPALPWDLWAHLAGELERGGHNPHKEGLMPELPSVSFTKDYGAHRSHKASSVFRYERDGQGSDLPRVEGRTFIIKPWSQPRYPMIAQSPLIRDPP